MRTKFTQKQYKTELEFTKQVIGVFNMIGALLLISFSSLGLMVYLVSESVPIYKSFIFGVAFSLCFLSLMFSKKL